MLENETSDFRNTGGLLSHDWLLAFWATWIALLLPAVFSHVRVASDESRNEVAASESPDGRHLSIR